MIDISKLKRMRKDDLFIWAISRYSIPDEIETKKDLLEWLEVQLDETPRRTKMVRERTTQKDFLNYPSALPTGRMS